MYPTDRYIAKGSSTSEWAYADASIHLSRRCQVLSANRILETWRRTAECRARYGHLQGLLLWNQLRQEYKQPYGELIRVRVPGVKHPVLMRAGVNDIGTFYQVVIRDQGSLIVPGVPKFIIDAGANIGLTSILLASRYPSAQVVALEVDTGNFSVLMENARPYRNLCCLRKALWCTSGYVRIRDSTVEPNAYQVVLASSHEPGAIEATTVADLLLQFEVAQADLVKVDIEGAEIEVMSTASSWLPSVRMLAIETHDRMRPGCTAALELATRNFPHSRSQHGEYEVLVFE